MTISDLVRKLNAAAEEHGDISVKLYSMQPEKEIDEFSTEVNTDDEEDPVFFLTF